MFDMGRGPAAAVPLEGGAWLRADDRNRAKTTRWPASCLYSLETDRPTADPLGPEMPRFFAGTRKTSQSKVLPVASASVRLLSQLWRRARVFARRFCP